MGRDRGGEKQWVRDLSEETAGAEGEERKGTERYRGAEERQGRRYGNHCLPAAACSWIVLSIRLSRKGVEKCAPPNAARLISLS